MTTTMSAPQEVFCVLEGAHRSCDVADAVVAGRFTVAGSTADLGPEPDWTCDPCPSDKEWRVEWVKFYYGLDLAHACATTGEPRYLDAWLRLVRSYMNQRPPGTGESEVIARRVQNWIYTWNRFAREAGCVLPEHEASEITGYLWKEVREVRANLTPDRNHRTLELYALLVASLAFPELDPEHQLSEFAFEELHQNLLVDIRPDGVHREASTHYHCVALRSYLGAAENIRRMGLGLPPSFVARVTAASEFALHCHRPDGRIPACSDADGEDYRDVLLLAARVLDRPDFLWGATLGREGAPPRRRFASFAHGGYFVQRSGWGDVERFEHERFLLFDCGPLGDGGHGHYDLLHVEVAAHGAPILVDPGRFTYSETPPNWRRWFKGTAAHNTVLVDGTDQTPYARRKPKGPVASGRLLARASAPSLDLLVGEAISSVYDARHARAVLFVAGDYWLVSDYLVADRPHTYQQRWHLSPTAGAGLMACPGEGIVNADRVRLAFAPASEPRIEAGWYAPAYGVKHPAPVVVVEAVAATTMLLTGIEPRHPGGGPSSFGVRTVTHGDWPSERTTVEVVGVGPNGQARDIVTWATEPHHVHLAGFRGCARAAWARFDSCERVVAFGACDVVEGSWRGVHRPVCAGDGAPGLYATWAEGEPWLATGRTGL